MLPVTMRAARTLLIVAALGVLSTQLACRARIAEVAEVSEPGQDPVAAELAHWSAFLRDKTRTGGFWDQVRKANLPIVGRAQEDLKAGRRLLAMQRLANVRANVSALTYLSQRPARQRQ